MQQEKLIKVITTYKTRLVQKSHFLLEKHGFLTVLGVKLLMLPHPKNISRDLCFLVRVKEAEGRRGWGEYDVLFVLFGPFWKIQK